jgi:acyl transferase domain-containing protein/3-hydroxymyristoyl/3-hydroxydecanoyl-(acyl carrier protein) dehydratase/1-acyl-sn-glycerol-3-phosphate acyltransferase
MPFEPIAIIGKACLFPGALNAQDLWDLALKGKDVLTKVPSGYWRTDPKLVLVKSPKDAQDQTWCDRGGYVQGFESVFDPEGFALSSDEISKFDPLFHWVLHTAREALRDAGYLADPRRSIGAIFGNLSYPSHSLNQFSESIWLETQGPGFLGGKARELSGVSRPSAINRFTSGLPAHILARALELNAEALALDSACASSLYAIKLACDRLHDRNADLMLAGGVNRADDLIIHVGFCVLQAMSQSGRSRPFHKNADGLVPSEGAGFVVLKRLDDAVEAGDKILGVIRAVGLSNDGKGQGMLVPSKEGQEKAIRQAYEMSGLAPADISLVECHATGTPVGDQVEVMSMSEVYQGLRDIPIGTIKSNMGHSITASGVAGLIKVLGAMKAGIRPPTLHVEKPIDVLRDSPFRLLTEAEPWTCTPPRRAVINNFGFGGNNAHLIVEEWDASVHKKRVKLKLPPKTDVAIVGMGAVVADAATVEDFANALFTGTSRLRRQDNGRLSGFAEPFELPLLGLRFSPADLDQALPQQLLILKAAMNAMAEVDHIPAERTGVMVGMGCDAEAARSGMCWRLAQFAREWSKNAGLSNMKAWISTARDQISPVRKAGAIIGAMPNIPANRICSQFDLRGPSFTVSSEELSGMRCLDLAVRALRTDELDAAVVGAVDLCCEPVHQAAAKDVLDDERQIPGDAAVVLILKRLEDARRDGDKIYAILSDEAGPEPTLQLGLGQGQMNLIPLFGHAHAASGLVHVAAAALACHYRALPAGEGELARPWFASQGPRAVEVSIRALGGESAATVLIEDTKINAEPICLEPVPSLHIYSGSDRKEVLRNLLEQRESEEGPARLVLVAASEDELAELRNHAQHLIEKNESAKGHMEAEEGIYFRERPIGGELCLVFTGSAGVYPGMGQELLLAFPEVIDDIRSQFPSLQETAGWIYERDAHKQQTPEKMLWASSFLSQVHARITRKYLGIVPQAVLGFSSGESNSLFAMGAWKDMDEMFQEFREIGVFSREVGGEFSAIQRAWKKQGDTQVDWVNWGLLAPEDDVLAALEQEPLVHLLVINAPGEFVIGGQADACERIVNRFGRERAYRLEYNVATHCPEIKVYSEEWRRLHHRHTSPVPGVRFYTAATCSHYQPTADDAADALLGMASHTLDFPRMVRNAWNDGVRVFLEHGPRDSCTRWVRRILGDNEHLAISMDRAGKSSLIQAIHATAQLVAAGVKVNHHDFIGRWVSRGKAPQENYTQADSAKRAFRTYAAHPPRIQLPPLVTVEERETMKTLPNTETDVMPPAPWLPPVLQEGVMPTGSGEGSRFVYEGNLAISEKNEILIESMPTVDVHEDNGSPTQMLLNEIVAQHASISSIHKDFLAQQAQIHQRFLESRHNALDILIRASSMGTAPSGMNQPWETGSSSSFQPSEETMPPVESFIEAAPAPETQPTPAMAEPSPTPVTDPKPHILPDRPKVAKSAPSNVAKQFLESLPREPVGPTFSHEQLEILASGKISEVFGPLFEKQDGYHRQVRLPEPPLLLTDRVTGIDAEPGSMGKGVIWTETDVHRNAWYMNDGYMPPGITVESGQSDLLLISWLGVDFLNKSERVYRLLGCDLVYYGTSPRAGDTLCYEIHVDGHANVGDVRIFFFHYDCRINGELRLCVRNAQAGFFTDQELADSGGILWKPETGEIKQNARLDPPAVTCTRSEFSIDQVKAFSEGRVYECFGPGFEIAETHSKTPKIQSGKMLLLDRVTHFDPKGGPWKRGYLRVENQIPPDAWYLVCHFKNDPCMPGTLMSDACLQAMSFYLTAMGYTLNKDGWRFEPVPEEIYHIKCRGQVTPDSKRLSYEVFVEEIIDGPYPTIYADILGVCDGLKILHIRRMGLRLVPEWPLDCWPHLLEGHVEKRPVARVGDMEFGYKSMLACAFGRPSDAFGELGRPFDGGRHISRLPGPPYHFMTRVSRIEAEMGAMNKGETIEVEYDIPPDEWYFEENGNRSMPFCVLMEVALQPCGWLAVFEGGPLTSEHALYFRNLDGTGTITTEILPDTGTIRTRTTLTNISRIQGVTLVNFDVECFVGDKTVYEMKTGFGFFSKEALDQQVGLPATDEDRTWLDAPSDFLVDLTDSPEKYCGGELRLPKPMLLMLDRVTGYWPKGGGKGLGRLRAEKTVNISEWFFKAHFFHDPVQPGSLGVESIIQLLQFYMLHENMHEGLEHPRFTPISINSPVTWKYRGQVTPDKKRISIEMDIVEQGRDEQGPYAVAEAWLWADKLRIFHVKDLKMHIVEGNPRSDDRDVSERGISFPDPCVLPGLRIREKVAHQLKVHPSSVSLAEDGQTAVCESMPLNRFPLVVKGEKDGAPVIEVGASSLDFERVFDYSRRLLDIGPWFGEDAVKGLYDLFARHLILEDPQAFENIKDRSALYLGNHQVQVESILFPLLAQVLTETRIVTIANANHQTGWMGPMYDIMYAYPGVTYPRNVVYFDQEDRKSMFDIIDRLKAGVADEGASVFLHVEGRLGLSCRHPVRTLSSVFVDLALDADLPIVPVRFVGGLPVKEMETTLDFPVGYGKQDYYMGRPIMPDELRVLPYAERRKFVMDAINNLGPSNETEVPNPPNSAFEKEVKTWIEKTGATEVKAVLFKAFETLQGPTTEETRALIRAAYGDRKGFGSGAMGSWLSEMAHWLFG